MFNAPVHQSEAERCFVFSLPFCSPTTEAFHPRLSGGASAASITDQPFITQHLLLSCVNFSLFAVLLSLLSCSTGLSLRRLPRPWTLLSSLLWLVLLTSALSSRRHLNNLCFAAALYFLPETLPQRRPWLVFCSRPCRGFTCMFAAL